MRRSIVLLVLAAACSRPLWVYHPTASTVAHDGLIRAGDHAAVRYPLPRGEVVIGTIGIVPVTPADKPDGRKEELLQVRMVVHNGDSGVWTVAASDQLANIGGVVEAQPRFGACDGQDLGVAVLMPGETRTMDLYYDLPWIKLPRTHPPWVSVDWRVRTPARVLARATSVFDASRPTRQRPPPREVARAAAAPSIGRAPEPGAALPPPDRGQLDGGPAAH